MLCVDKASALQFTCDILPLLLHSSLHMRLEPLQSEEVNLGILISKCAFLKPKSASLQEEANA